MNKLFETEANKNQYSNEWDGRYNIIYADPPWEYNDKRPGGSKDHYSVMNIERLKNLPVNKISADNSVLFIWVVFPMLQEGLDLIRSWGFEYKTVGFNWIKTTKNNSLFWGEGSYTRSNSELCLIGIKGKLKTISHSVHSVILSEVRKHSQKPDIIRNKIVQLYGDLPRIELFARERFPGWDCFGNEVNSDIDLNSNIITRSKNK